jgi:hypothetical protein
MNARLARLRVGILERKDHDRARTARPKPLLEPAIEAPRQFIDNLEAVSRPNFWRRRSVVRYTTFDKRAGAQQLQSNLSIAARECVPRRVDYKLVDD